MPKIMITGELAEAIRGLRNENKVSAKSLAEHIGKSQSYVSKLEKGHLKTISKSELDNILSFVIHDSHSYLDRVNEILKLATYRYSSKEMEEQVWFSNYSSVFCEIPIPSELIDDINQRMKEHNISVEYLCTRINANEFIMSDIDIQNLVESKYPINEWFEYPQGSKKIIIIMRVKLERLIKVLEKKFTSVNYVLLQAVTQYLFKIMRYKDLVNISVDESEMIARDAKSYLQFYNYYPISEKYRRIQAAEQLSIPDQENQYEISRLNEFIRIRSDLNLERTNKNLISLNRNIEWNSAFIEKMVTLPFADLGSTSYSFNKKILDQFEDILNKALCAPTKEKMLEEYN